MTRTHGNSRYNVGCRCDVCRAGKARYNRENRAKLNARVAAARNRVGPPVRFPVLRDEYDAWTMGVEASRQYYDRHTTPWPRKVYEWPLGTLRFVYNEAFRKARRELSNAKKSLVAIPHNSAGLRENEDAADAAGRTGVGSTRYPALTPTGEGLTGL